MLGNLIHAIECLLYFVVALKPEGNGDNSHCQDACILGALGDDGGCSRACASAHAGRDEHRACTVVEHLLDLIEACQGSLLGSFRPVAGSQTVFSQLQMIGHWRVVECFLVGVAQYVGNIVNALPVHVVDGISSATAHSNHLDDAWL